MMKAPAGVPAAGAIGRTVSALRRRWALALAALAAWPSPLLAGPGVLAPPSAAPVLVTPIAVFGTDDRVAPPARYGHVAEHIGLFFSNPARTVCTAFCVAPNIVATAAHCLAQPGGKPARIADFMFARGYDRVREFARVEGHAANAANQSVMSGDFQHRVKPPIDAANDWALVRLSRNACPGNGLAILPMPADQIMNAAKAGKVFQLSYHRDWTQWRLAYSTPCHVGRDFQAAGWSSIAPDFLSADQMILHHCDTGGASSGSPMLVETKAGVAVVGINVGTYVQSKILSDRGQVTLRERAETVANTAVNAAVFAEHVDRLRSATILGSSQQIRSLQERLAARSLYNHRIDGSYGPGLRAAIEGFERENRLPVTGLATADLLKRLDGQAPGGLGRVAPSSAPHSGTSPAAAPAPRH
ncbi:MAG: peptidoglycan-binding protein [Hyphomicrobiaceae bacterium]|nr:peptidoglycan-binding protein [Hyphomicrobiaceae bacterium]